MDLCHVVLILSFETHAILPRSNTEAKNEKMLRTFSFSDIAMEPLSFGPDVCSHPDFPCRYACMYRGLFIAKHLLLDRSYAALNLRQSWQTTEGVTIELQSEMSRIPY